MIISWKHEDHMESVYGKLLGIVEGTYEDAATEAKGIASHSDLSPIGLCGVIE